MQQAIFLWERFLDFYYHIRLRKYFLSRNDFGSLIQIILIGDAATFSGLIFQ